MTTYTTALIGAVSAGDIIATGNYVGGIIGTGADNACVRWSAVTGNVSGGSYVGGLAGRLAASTAYVQDSYALSEVEGSGSYVGGIAGYIYPGSASKNCFYYNTGNGVTGSGFVSMLHSGETSAAKLYYLSDTDSNTSAKTAEEFAENVVLNLLQTNADTTAAYYWAAGSQHPIISQEAPEAIHRVRLINKGAASEENYVSFSADAGTVYGTAGEEA
ncbi:MAG: hypothetical protein LUG13_06340 [Oscillospiraceae bacterium]|nr:hypothetical protein [Oscillospiraceae bacterium]